MSLEEGLCFRVPSRAAESADAVLISHGTVAHAGALPLLYRRLWKEKQQSTETEAETETEPRDEQRAAPLIFCTHAAQKLGAVASLSAVEAAQECVRATAEEREGEQTRPSLSIEAADVASAFSLCTPLRFHQTVRVAPRPREEGAETSAAAVYVHCLRSGLNIGGAVWILEVDRHRVVLLPPHSLQPLW